MKSNFFGEKKKKRKKALNSLIQALMVIIIPFLTTMGTERGGRARLLRHIVPLLINNYGDSCMNFKKKGLALAVATAAAATGST